MPLVLFLCQFIFQQHFISRLRRNGKGLVSLPLATWSHVEKYRKSRVLSMRFGKLQQRQVLVQPLLDSLASACAAEAVASLLVPSYSGTCLFRYLQINSSSSKLIGRSDDAKVTIVFVAFGCSCSCDTTATDSLGTQCTM